MPKRQDGAEDAGAVPRAQARGDGPERGDSEGRGAGDPGRGAAPREGERPRGERDPAGNDPGTTDPATEEETPVDEDVVVEDGGEGAAEDALRSEADRLRQEVEELNDRHLRLAAEFDNFRRRSREELAESRVRGQVALTRDLLDVLDDLQRVRDVDPEHTSVQALLEGVEMVDRKFLKVLEEWGVEPVDPRGEPFDPETMEAMARVPADSEEEDDLVHEVYQMGYTMKGHLVRPARVSVRKLD